MSVKGTNENAWNKTQVRVDEDHDFQVIFEATLVNEIGSRVAIDDVIDASVDCHRYELSKTLTEFIEYNNKNNKLYAHCELVLLCCKMSN
ncbi:hypothetical protein DPMN_042946 [Dreissena polymorpha]|uniref:MAM domain-containing protein n=1 Tax=Dreissena polymorpha TaxID=45954 RepID=A0A9D4D2Z6_DREPO|nr:hypothetical protein DPMN_042946 [Dreissena polymorpha]